MSVELDGTEQCRHERAHITDSHFFGHVYGTSHSRAAFCDRCRMQRWLDIEAALAVSQAEMGIIPSPAASSISTAARLELLDTRAIAEEIRRTSHSLVALIRALEKAASPHGEFVHYGATTQDIQDTGQALEMRDVLSAAETIIADIVRKLIPLVRKHRSTVMVGRTHAQPALPTTFGLKVAGWLDELLRGAERLAMSRERILVAQLGGGVGTQAGFGSRGPELIALFAAKLGLGAPRIAWHVSRDRVAEFVWTLASISSTMGRICDEIRTLSRPEFGELEEGWTHGRVGSSTMPHKRNPEAPSQVVVLARLTRAQVGIALEGMIQEHERDSRGLRLEWVAVADASHYALAAMEITNRILGGLSVQPGRMTENVERVQEFILTEGLMFHLASAIGKQSAHALMYDISQQAISQRRSINEVLRESSAARESLRGVTFDSVVSPANYLGSAVKVAGVVADDAERWLNTVTIQGQSADD